MGFLRQRQPPSPNAHHRAAVTVAITCFVAEEIIAIANAASDPFGIDDPCPFNAGGIHRFIGSCGDVACAHCSKVAWS